MGCRNSSRVSPRFREFPIHADPSARGLEESKIDPTPALNSLQSVLVCSSPQHVGTANDVAEDAAPFRFTGGRVLGP